MRATDIVRQVLDLLDQVEGQHDIEPEAIVSDCYQEPDDRFKSILAMLDKKSFGPLANSPNEVIAPVSAVTSDIKGNPQDVRMTDPSR